MNTLTFEVDLPPRGHAGNGSHGHWSGASRERRAYRRHVGTMASSAFNRGTWARPDGVLRVSLVFGIKGGRTVRRYQPRDVPNAIAAFKGGFDGLTDAGLIVDDSARHMELGPVIINSAIGPFVRVTVEAIDGD